MVFKRVLAIVLVAVCLCLSSSLSVFAETTHSNIDVGVSPAYEIAKNPTSNLSINGQTAFCTSTTDGVDTVSITVEQTLEKYSGWFWIWNGGNTSQFVVVDPYHSTVFPSKLSNFFATYSATKKIGTFND